MAGRPWAWMAGAAIPVVWIWFALLGVRWNVLVSLFIAIASTILLGTLYAVIEPPRGRSSNR